MATSISSDLCRARAEVALADIDVYALRQAEATRRLADAEPVLERAHDAEGLGRIALIRGQLNQLAKGNEDPGATPFFERAAAWFVEAGDKHGKVEADFGALEAITTPGEELDRRAARVIDEARAVGDRGLEGRRSASGATGCSRPATECRRRETRRRRRGVAGHDLHGFTGHGLQQPRPSLPRARTADSRAGVPAEGACPSTSTPPTRMFTSRV